MLNKSTIHNDIITIIILVILTIVFVLVPPLNETPIRIILGLPMVLFIPGYSLIAALFPKKDDLDGIERIALSFGLSIAVVPLIGLGLNYTPWGIRLIPIIVSLSTFTILMCVATIIRRSSLDENEVFTVPFKSSLESIKTELLTPPEDSTRPKLDKALSIILVISIIASIATLAYVVTTPKQGEKFTEFYVLGPNGMADDYPTELEKGEKGTVIIGITNHEYEKTEYTLKMQLENNTLPIDNNAKTIALKHNQTWEDTLKFTPHNTGTNMKLEFLLYKDNNFTEPYRNLHLWVNVSEN
ncbi:Protein of unknown function DUF1616 (plasmid) [Methanohalobium evestigatum Z-7303]|uniref:DUF1616 domain-containing protein n=1 Tax=Methanohalobium evestigatum (strain ATCC BAA-1072 / DSM 3721 / NBRC 107634 / OCM 161 / Z-7303) TaxID=644295 RepID=D7EC09_METEZ|nr:DUF1616 domain-containing protein [Methanohalobium evestigatum]ADI75131.1 Protein of unknown function DUF1616 [Methanohalobium evestigatum Z-7303]